MRHTLKMMVAGLLFNSSAAFASGGGNTQGGLLVYLFLGFGALIVTFQLVPAVILFATMLKEFFSRPAKRAAVADSSHSKV